MKVFLITMWPHNYAIACVTQRCSFFFTVFDGYLLKAALKALDLLFNTGNRRHNVHIPYVCELPI